MILFISCWNYSIDLSACETLSFCFFNVSAIPIIMNVIKVGYSAKNKEWLDTSDNTKANNMCRIDITIIPTDPMMKNG